MKQLMMLFIVLVFTASMLNATVIFTQDFNVSSQPANWSIEGSIGTSHTVAGTPKSDTDFFKNNGGNNYLRLTENTSWNRAWAYYTGAKFPIMGKWKLTAEVRIGKTHDGSEITAGADGLCFVFADASTVETDGAFDLSKVEGGYGEYEGAPRGAYATASKGYHAGFKGFSLEFDHYDNANEISREYNHWVGLTNWQHSYLGKDMSTDTGFYYNDGWVRVQIDADNGVITFRYNWTGSAYSNSVVIDATNPPNPLCADIYAYDAYVGVSAATGGQASYHEIRYMSLDVTEETLPVELSSFSAVQNSETTSQINWVTQSETGVNGFNVLRGTDNDLTHAVNVSPLIPAYNQSTTQTYRYVDTDLVNSGVYYYWLQIQDLDGTSQYSNSSMLNFQIGSTPSLPDNPINSGIISLYPNPFNPSTTISYGLEVAADVHFSIYNTRGQLVRNFTEANKAAGYWKASWNGMDNNGKSCSSGIYSIIMQSGSQTTVRKAVLLK